MLINGCTRLCCQRRALYSCLGIGYSMLIGSLSNGKALQANIEARMVHHSEHNLKPLILLPNQIANRAIIIAILKNSGRRAFNTKFFLYRNTFHIILLVKSAVFIDKNFWNNKQRYTLNAFWCIWGSSKN